MVHLVPVFWQPSSSVCLNVSVLMQICFVSSECVPYVKTGGLADVAGALPKSLAMLGHQVKVFLPLYESINTIEHDLVFAHELSNIAVGIGDSTITFNTWYGHLPDSEAEVYLIDCPHYYHRPTVYTNDHDEDERYILLQHAVPLILQRFNWAPDIVHCNDWQTGLLPVFLYEKYNWDSLFRQTATVMSIHNIGYQGRFHDSAIYKAGLSYDRYYPGGPYEFENSFSFLKTGLVYATVLSTVSETYAQEIQTPEYGAGLEGLLASRRHDLFGILNGVDTTDWNPQTDPFIAANYSLDTLDEKQANKRALLDEFGLGYNPSTPTIGIVSRFASQKGFELLQLFLNDLLQHHDFQLIVLGSGDTNLENFFRWAAHAYPHKVGAYIGYNNRLAHRIEAGADMFLMPSRYEPCGLNQMYSLAYGTIPIVRKTGGLADTVHDQYETHGNGNGISFYDFTPHALYTSMLRAFDLYRQPEVWHAMQSRGMTTDFSWQASAEKYVHMYEEAIRRHQSY